MFRFFRNHLEFCNHCADTLLQTSQNLLGVKIHHCTPQTQFQVPQRKQKREISLTQSAESFQWANLKALL